MSDAAPDAERSSTVSKSFGMTWVTDARGPSLAFEPYRKSRSTSLRRQTSPGATAVDMAEQESDGLSVPPPS